MYFRQVVWQVVIKIVIGKRQSEGEKPPAKTTVAFVATPSKEHHTLASTCLAIATPFFHSKVQGLQDTVSLLLICQSPHSNAFVNSRAADAHRSLSLGVGTQVFSHVYMYFHFKPAWSWTLRYLCAFFDLAPLLALSRKHAAKSQWNEASCSSGLIFLNLKSFHSRVVSIW